MKTKTIKCPASRGSAAQFARPMGEGQDVMLTKEELAGKLKVAIRSIENWQHEGYLPFIKVGNVVIFYWPTVLAHLQAHFSVTPCGGPPVRAARAIFSKGGTP
ncbi:MAG: hypothetical protein WCS42_16785 [Verrucomicrobiota bacterium]